MIDTSKLDPRAFLSAYSHLWVVNTDNPRDPLLRGNMIIPIRLIDFVKQNSITHPVNGEHCLKFATAFWEAPPEYYTKKQPQYRGKVTVFTPDLTTVEMQELYRRANNIRNLKLDRGTT